LTLILLCEVSLRSTSFTDLFEKISGFYDFAPSFLGQNRGFGFGNLEKKRQKTENRGFQGKIEDFGGCGGFVTRGVE